MTEATLAPTITPTNKTYMRLVGKSDDNFYLLREIRTPANGKQVITASVLHPITEDDMCHARDNYDYKSAWQEAVSNDETEDGLSRWSEYYDIEMDQLFELATHAHAKLVYDHIDVDDCEGIQEMDYGMCFSPNMEWQELYEPNLWAFIKRILLANQR